MTFASDATARPNDPYGYGAAAELPPLPTLAPLPVIRPMAPMPRPPWESEDAPVAAPSRPIAPPPPVGHPAAYVPDAPAYVPDAPSYPATPVHPAAPQRPVAETQTSTAPTPARGPAGNSPFNPATPAPQTSAPAAPASRHTAPSAPETPAVPETPVAAVPEVPAAAPQPPSPAQEQSPVGRHSTGPTAPWSAALGRHVLLLGGAEPLGEMIAERLISAGHLVATANITLPTEVTPHHDRDGQPITTAEPVTLTCDRTDSDDVVHTVARAEVALGGLDAIVVLPAADNSTINLDADAATWADEWSMALTQEVLAAASACHIAARSFLARRRAGRIVLVTSRVEGGGVRPSGTVHAAMTALGADLGRDLRPHGIGVSVVAAGNTADFGLGQVADVVEALLTTPVLSEVGARIG